MSRGIIITSYIDAPFPMKERIKDGDYIICADGGYRIAMENGIEPDLLLGDFDSMTREEMNIPAHIPVKEFNPEKDYTDLQLCLDTVIEMGFTDVEIWGGIGGRLDHTIANIQLMANYSKELNSLVMLDGQNECFILYGDNEASKHTLNAGDKRFIGLFALSEECQRVSIEGAKYPLTSHTLTSTFPLGVSNEFTAAEATITIGTGTLLVCLCRD
jgi:thiamine pyrophosphokinase